MFKNCLNSLLEEDPEPSAMLFDMDIPDPLSCSTKRYNLLSSRSFAMSKSLLAIWIAEFPDLQVLKPEFYHRFELRYAPCAVRYALMDGRKGDNELCSHIDLAFHLYFSPMLLHNILGNG